jgi:hypothetical protein
VQKKKIHTVKKMSPQEQHLFAAKTMGLWHTLAERDEKYNKGRETANCKAGNKILCNFYKREVGWCDEFGDAREILSEHERNLANRGI